MSIIAPLDSDLTIRMTLRDEKGTDQTHHSGLGEVYQCVPPPKRVKPYALGERIFLLPAAIYNAIRLGGKTSINVLPPDRDLPSLWTWTFEAQ